MPVGTPPALSLNRPTTTGVPLPVDELTPMNGPYCSRPTLSAEIALYRIAQPGVESLQYRKTLPAVVSLTTPSSATARGALSKSPMY